VGVGGVGCVLGSKRTLRPKRCGMGVGSWFISPVCRKCSKLSRKVYKNCLRKCFLIGIRDFVINLGPLVIKVVNKSQMEMWVQWWAEPALNRRVSVETPLSNRSEGPGQHSNSVPNGTQRCPWNFATFPITTAERSNCILVGLEYNSLLQVKFSNPSPQLFK
jgi:hypothetical protein